jgi:YHS domain-containing protein
MATDPVCGALVETDTAVIACYGEMLVYFCSEECRYAFENSPSDFLPEEELSDEERARHWVLQ